MLSKAGSGLIGERTVLIQSFAFLNMTGIFFTSGFYWLSVSVESKHGVDEK
jgi:hypothetical protein